MSRRRPGRRALKNWSVIIANIGEMLGGVKGTLVNFVLRHVKKMVPAYNIPNTISIAILVDKNPFPLNAVFDFANGALAEVSARLKLGQTSLVKAIAKADGKFYIAQKECKVTVGGCGG